MYTHKKLFIFGAILSLAVVIALPFFGNKADLYKASAQATCGNGTIEIGEQCDDGGTANGDGCSSECQGESSDGCYWTFEGFVETTYLQCALDCADLFGYIGGYNVNTESCVCLNETSTECDGIYNALVGFEVPNPFVEFFTCGNGTTELAEQCDDNNLDNGDGCDSTCKIEFAPLGCTWTHLYFPLTTNEECSTACIDYFGYPTGFVFDDGCICYDETPEKCDTELCPLLEGSDGLKCGYLDCGDGINTSGEQCDDGKNCENGDSCTEDSQCSGIGDELCLTRDGDGCDSTCQIEFAPLGCTWTHLYFPLTTNEECSTACIDYFGYPTGFVFDDGCICYDETPEKCDTELCPLLEGSDGLKCGYLDCGDGINTSGEQCDDGKNCENGDSCTEDSQCSGIGDELCLTRDGDGCDSTCKIESADVAGCFWDWDGFTPGIGDCQTYCELVFGLGYTTGYPTSNDQSCICDNHTNLVCNDLCEILLSEWGVSNLVCGTFACGNGITEEVEQCDDGGLCTGDDLTSCTSDEDCTGPGGTCTPRNDDGCSTTCTIEPDCGNGTIERGEQCDDGGTSGGDGCSATCLLEGETVDGCYWDYDYFTPSEGTCLYMCTNVGFFGVGYTDGYSSDDGAACICDNHTAESCDAVCVGLGAIGVGNPICESFTCGNGITEITEQCDDGNLIDGDGCDSTCKIEFAPLGCTWSWLDFPFTTDEDCSNLCIYAFEYPAGFAFDDGCICYDETSEKCDNELCVEISGYDNLKCGYLDCGDGVLTSGEQCDDYNLIDGDGCDSTCKIEFAPLGCNWTWLDFPFTTDEECSSMCINYLGYPAGFINNDGCLCYDHGEAECDVLCGGFEGSEGLACGYLDCGDGNLTSGEECDDGNLINGDGCSSICTDGYIDTLPPDAIDDLSVTYGKNFSMSWTTPVDNGGGTVISRYAIRISDSPITDEAGWENANDVYSDIIPADSGSTEEFNIYTGFLTPGTYYFAVRSYDNVYNLSDLNTNSPISAVLPDTKPVITAISPSSGVNDSVVPITITGSNFVIGGNNVHFVSGNIWHKVTVGAVSEEEIQMDVPANMPPGVYSVVVVNSNGVSETITSGFIVQEAVLSPPVVTAISPSSAASNSTVDVEIIGMNLTGASQIQISDGKGYVYDLDNINVVSDTEITATVPAGINDGIEYDVFVTTPNGTNAFSAQKYTVSSVVIVAPTTSSAVTIDEDEVIDLSGFSGEADTTLPKNITIQNGSSTAVGNVYVTNITATVSAGTTITDSTGTRYAGQINPPRTVSREEALGSDVYDQLTDDSVIIEMGNPDERLEFDKDFVITLAIMSDTAPIIWYYNRSEGTFELAGKNGVLNEVTYVSGGTVIGQVGNIYTIGILTDHMSAYVTGVSPAITSVSPSTGSSGSSITITGTNFHTNATVTIGGSLASSTYVDTENLTVIVPGLSVGSHSVVVENPDLLSATSNFIIPDTGGSIIVPNTGGGGLGGSSVVATRQALLEAAGIEEETDDVETSLGASLKEEVAETLTRPVAPSISRAVVQVANKFMDTSQHWAKSYIDKLYTENIVSGKTATEFEPDSSITRAEVVKIALNAFNISIPTKLGYKPFPDVEMTDWYAPYMQAARVNGIVRGFPDGIRPNEYITRAEALKILLTATGLPITFSTTKNFTDTKTNAWYMWYVRYAYENGIVSGNPDGSFCPSNSITRAEIAKITSKLMDHYISQQ